MCIRDRHIPGPDFPTGGVIIGKDIIKQGYKSGRGSFKIRGNINIEQLKNGKTKVLGYFVGLVMKETQGKANPQKVNELIQAHLR